MYSVVFFLKVKHKFKMKTAVSQLSPCLLDPEPQSSWTELFGFFFRILQNAFWIFHFIPITFVASHLCYGGNSLSHWVPRRPSLLCILSSPVSLMLLNVFIMFFYFSKSFKNFFVPNRLESKSRFRTCLDLNSLAAASFSTPSFYQPWTKPLAQIILGFFFPHYFVPPLFTPFVSIFPTHLCLSFAYRLNWVP